MSWYMVKRFRLSDIKLNKDKTVILHYTVL